MPYEGEPHVSVSQQVQDGDPHGNGVRLMVTKVGLILEQGHFQLPSCDGAEEFSILAHGTVHYFRRIGTEYQLDFIDAVVDGSLAGTSTESAGVAAESIVPAWHEWTEGGHFRITPGQACYYYEFESAEGDRRVHFQRERPADLSALPTVTDSPAWNVSMATYQRHLHEYFFDGQECDLTQCDLELGLDCARSLLIQS